MSCPNCGRALVLDGEWYECRHCWHVYPLFCDVARPYDEPPELVYGPPELQWAETDLLYESRRTK